MFVAWTGGVAFVVSLLYLVYFYVVTLESAAGNPADRLTSALINISLFLAFALHHSVFARSSAKQFMARVVASAHERTVYVWVASILAVAMCALWQPVAGLAYVIEGWWRLLFWVVQASGVLLVLRGARVLSALELAGIQQARGTPGTAPLKIVGPFRTVRHPIYLGWVLMVFGAPTMTTNRLLFAAVSTLYLILAIPWEEKSLVEGYGDRYREYQRTVRWRLVPGIW